MMLVKVNFYKPTCFLGKVVTFITRSKFSHVDYTFMNRRISASKTAGKVTENDERSHLYMPDTVIRLMARDEDLIAHAELTIGKEYGNLDLFLFLLKSLYPFNGKGYICSEHVAEMINQCVLGTPELDIANISPGGVYKAISRGK